ncbi:MAG TPA: amino acid permease [Ramlibacter sp.]|uniref:APC family permease n=1 Tax=Ramlibacter sp. TaxID=1917967 RepID=UPI002ED3748F
MSPAAISPSPAEPHPVLGLRAIVMLTVGVVIGAGIFKAPSMVAGMAGDTAWMFGAWILGGVISLIGALCYAELATSHPSAGGDYHFLRLAYGRGLAFLFAWARFAVITTGSIALLAFVFGDYMQQVLPLGASGSFVYAVAIVLLLWWVNARGIRAGTSAQVALTSLEILGLLAIVLAGAWLASSGSAPVAAATKAGSTPGAGAFGLAMVFVLLTYGGWNEAAYVSAELKDNRRNMVLGLVAAIALITALYLLVTWAYWRGLGLQGLAKSEAPAADLLAAAFGAGASKLMSLAVAIAALTSINATMIVGARSNYAAGRDWPALHPIGRWDVTRSTPRNAMHLQNAAALLLLAVGAWTGGGFRAMVEFTAPVFWLFFLLTGIALFLLRRRAPAAPAPYRVPLYPVLPALFCATCAYMLWSSLSYVSSQSLGGFNAAWIGVAVLAAGALVLALLHARPAATALRPSSEEKRA